MSLGKNQLSFPMRHFLLLTAVCCCFSTGFLRAQADPISEHYPLGGSVEVLAKRLGEQSRSVLRYDAQEVRFPQAGHTETHLRATGLRIGGGILDRAVFTFADGKLVAVQARGGVNAMLENQGADRYNTYHQYHFFKDSGLVVQPDRDQLWLLNEEGMHLNLFGWEHPMLADSFDGWADYSNDVAIPQYLEMGEALGRLEPLLEQVSDFIIREELDGSDPNAQLQLNCYGIAFAGFPRKVEARFGNDTLNTVWILTGRGEEDRLRSRLTERYGPPVFVSDAWEAFSDWQVFLRKDKPEVLLLTPELGYFYRDTYFIKPPEGE